MKSLKYIFFFLMVIGVLVVRVPQGFACNNGAALNLDRVSSCVVPGSPHWGLLHTVPRGLPLSFIKVIPFIESSLEEAGQPPGQERGINKSMIKTEIELDDKGARLACRKHLKITSDKHPGFLTWSELHDLRSRTVKAMESLLNKVEADDRDFSDEELRGYTFAEVLASEIQTEFDLREKSGDKGPRLKENTGGPQLMSGRDNRVKEVDPRSARALFRLNNPSDADFKTFGEYLTQIASRDWDPRFRDLRTMTAGSGVGGGYLVPQRYAADIIDDALSMEVVRPRATVIPMRDGGSSLKIPVFDNEDTSSALFGGLSMAWTGEGVTLGTQTPGLRELELTPNKGGFIVKVSNEALRDATLGGGLDRQLQRIMARTIARGLESAFISGNGVNKPYGGRDHVSSITTTRAGAGAIAYADLTSLYSDMAPEFVADAVWMVSPSAVPQLMSVVDSNNNLVWLPGTAGSISQGVPQQLFGRPVLISPHCASLGSRGDLMFVSWSQYIIAMSLDIAVQVSEHIYFTSDATAFRVLVRVDGQPAYSKKLTLENGDTASWCCVLE